MSAVCRSRGWALIADEVFADYPLEAIDPVTDIAGRATCSRSRSAVCRSRGAAPTEAWLVHRRTWRSGIGAWRS